MQFTSFVSRFSHLPLYGMIIILVVCKQSRVNDIPASSDLTFSVSILSVCLGLCVKSSNTDIPGLMSLLSV